MPTNVEPSRKILMLAYVFPPFFSVGGSIRIVKFIKYLPAFGWLPIVLTIDDQQEYATQRREGSAELLKEIPPAVEVCRTKAGEQTLRSLERERLAAGGNWLSRFSVKTASAARRWATRTLLLPDRHIAWLPFALQSGRRICRTEGIDVIFATCPPHSAAVIGALLKRLVHKPLILDFRDDWIGTPAFEAKSMVRRTIERRMEKWAVASADKVILVTEWSRKAFVQRYPKEPAGKFALIPNGCDLAEFAITRTADEVRPGEKFTIVHAGLLNETGDWKRSPRALFQAVQHIVAYHPELGAKLRLAFTGHLPPGQKQMVEAMGITSMIQELGYLPRDEFIHFMRGADLLLAINYDDFATLIPGKIYEYWAIGGPPILLLSCPGAAQDLIDQHKLGITVSPFNTKAIERVIVDAFHKREAGNAMRVSTQGIEEYDRRNLALKLVNQLLAVQDLGNRASTLGHKPFLPHRDQV